MMYAILLSLQFFFREEGEERFGQDYDDKPHKDSVSTQQGRSYFHYVHHG